MAEGDHYRVLQVDLHAEPEVIEAAYRRLARKYHPDRREVEGDTTARMQALNAAYGTLRDPDRRALYDSQRERDAARVAVVSPAPARHRVSRRGVVAGMIGGALIAAGGLGLGGVAVSEYLDERDRLSARVPSQETIIGLTQRARLVAGPLAGAFIYTDVSAITRVEQSDADVTVRDFIAEARFFVPYDRREGKWDCGFLFRMGGPTAQYRLVLSSDGRYQLDLWGGGSATTMAHGPAEGLNTAPAGFNDLRLLAEAGRAYLYLNGTYLATFDIGGRVAGGDLAIASALFSGNALPRRAMRYERFTVLSLDQ